MNTILEPPVLPDVVRFAKTHPKTVRVAIVDADEEVRAGLVAAISSSQLCRLVRACADGESAVNHLPRFEPEVALLDILLPDLDGVECVRRLKAKMPSLHIIVFTECEDQNRVLKSLIAGAGGYLLKRSSPERLLAAIQEVCEGGVPMSPEIARCVLRQLRQSSATPAEEVKLTPREHEILDQLSKGFRYKEIVNNLGISFGTLHSYISKVYEKLHVHSRTEAVVKYLNL